MDKCHDPANHSNHVCQLKIDQKFDLVRELKKDATHFCKLCENPSNKPEHLCCPEVYKGKPGLLKWK